ncbi:hypothetical protein TrRE_jg13472 [Triparma retinervis]|uniref:VDE lipocalin domain-containing protein n=1 Tax=Triparma retinervis TaxID=2557542 RepID=A0A9W7DX11_9STRA|nr:hypothetical protein TrRE_jg13472 [Triparma retinervis]
MPFKEIRFKPMPFKPMPFKTMPMPFKTMTMPFKTTQSIKENIKHTEKSPLSHLLPLSLLSLTLLNPSPSNSEGFADYATTNVLPPPDISCFMTKCLTPTLDLASNLDSIKGLQCLGRCKGEQACAGACFNKFGNPSLDEFLNCALEREKCMPMPEGVGGGDISDGEGFEVAKGLGGNEELKGRWYKVAGVSEVYDMFDCQVNTVKDGGGKFWIIRYVGRTLQGSYEGGFVYSSRPSLTPGDRARVSSAWEAGAGAGDYAVRFKDIDNKCEAKVGGKGELRRDRGEGKVSGWGEVKELLVGEGGIGDWIRPGWRGEYDDK